MRPQKRYLMPKKYEGKKLYAVLFDASKMLQLNERKDVTTSQRSFRQNIFKICKMDLEKDSTFEAFS